MQENVQNPLNAANQMALGELQKVLKGNFSLAKSLEHFFV